MPAHPTDRPRATTPAPRPNRPRPKRRGKTVRRLAHAALFAAVRGLAYTTGTTAGAVILWWLTHR